MNQHCLNCSQPVHGNFCAHCGQKATTHRFSLRYFLVHDLVKKVFHFDKGILHTVKALFTRPGHSTREYIQGKRAQFLDYFTFIVLVIAAGHFVGTLSEEIQLMDTTQYFSGDEVLLSNFSTVTHENPKLFTLIRIPFLALFSFWFFKKSQHNYSEHIVLNTYKVAGDILVTVVFTLLAIVFKNVVSFQFFYNGAFIATLLYSVWFYYQYFSVFNYSKWSLSVRSVLTAFILILVAAAVTAFAVGVNDGLNDAL